MTEEIILIKTEDLEPHGLEELYYGEISVDDDFLASVEQRGVLTPVVVTRFGRNDQRFTIVSGHRRVKATRMLEIAYVPAIIRDYEDADFVELDFLHMNRQREKTNHQRMNEFLATKQLLKRIVKSKHLKALKKTDVYHDKAFLEALQKAKIDPEKEVNSIEILKRVSGFSEWEQKQLRIIQANDDTRVKQYEKLRKLGMTVDEENRLEKAWKEWREKLEQDQCSIKEACDSIKNLLAEMEAKYPEKKKKSKMKPKEKAILVEEVETGIEIEVQDPWMLVKPCSSGFTMSENPMEFYENKSVIDFFKPTNKKVGIGVCKTMGMPVGWAVSYEGVNYVIDNELIADIIVQIIKERK